jgi:hypothetical protein
MQGRASLIMHSYLDRQRIATQMTTQRTDRIDLYRFFTLIRSLRNGVTAYSALSPVSGLDSHRRLAERAAKLDPSVGESGPRAFAGRVALPRPAKPPRPSHPAPNTRDDREAPLQEETGHA